MDFTDKFIFSGYDSRNEIDVDKDGNKKGGLVFAFNYGNTKSDDPFAYNAELIFEEYMIHMSIVVRYKPARFFKELSADHHFRIRLEDRYDKDSDEYKQYSQENYEDNIYLKFTADMDAIDAFFDYVDFEYIDNLVREHFGDLDQVFHMTIKKIFE